MTSAYVEHPSFCFIAPTSFLSPLSNFLTKTHLVLAHLVDVDSSYAKFYRDRASSGDFIIMDNSAYELKEPYSPNRLMDLASDCGAAVIVLPDYPFKDSIHTINAAEQFASVFKANGFGTLFVPQSERGNLVDWVYGYQWAANNPEIDCIGYSILGIPNALPHIPPSYARVVMAQILLDRGIYATGKHSHYLGLNAGPSLEIPPLLAMGVLDTCDSSGPIWAAVNGHEYTANADSLQTVRKLTNPVDFHMPYTKDRRTIRRMQRNMHMTTELFQIGSTHSEVWYAEE